MQSEVGTDGAEQGQTTLFSEWHPQQDRAIAARPPRRPDSTTRHVRASMKSAAVLSSCSPDSELGVAMSRNASSSVWKGATTARTRGVGQYVCCTCARGGGARTEIEGPRDQLVLFHFVHQSSGFRERTRPNKSMKSDPSPTTAKFHSSVVGGAVRGAIVLTNASRAHTRLLTW